MNVAIHADAARHQIPGGIGAYVICLIEELRRDLGEGELTLLLARSGGPVPKQWSGLEIVRVPLPLKALYTSWNYARRPSVRGPVDIVHATSLVIPGLARSRLVATIYDDTVERFPDLVPGPWRRLYRRGLHLALREAHVLCAASHATADRLVEAYGVKSERIVVTPLAARVTPEIPPDGGTLARLGVRPPYVLNVGTLEPRKNQPMLVRAFADAAERLPDHQLVIAGAHGWGTKQLTEAVLAAGIDDRVVLTGRLEPDGLSALYAEADVFAMPSIYEGFGIPLAEAMSFGCPCVASEDAALVEVADGAALHAPHDDAPALADALVRASDDGELRRDLTQRGRDAAGRYSWKRTADLTREAYAIALDGGEGR